MTGHMTELTLLFVLLLGSGYFSGIETGVVSINRLRFHQLLRKKKPGAATVHRFMKDPDLFFGTTLVGTNLCNVAFSVVAAGYAERHFGPAGVWWAGLITIVLVLLFGEYLPKAWFQSRPMKRCMRFAPPLRFFARLFHVLIVPLQIFSRWLVPMRGAEITASAWTPQITREDLLHLLDPESGATPSLTDQERRLIAGVLSLSEATAGALMLPRSRLRILDQSLPVPALLEALRKDPEDRLPMGSPSGEIVGVLNVLEFLHHADDPGVRVSDYLRQPQFVSDDTPADELIARMRLNRQPLLFVRNRSGDIMGYVTTQLVLEHIASGLYGLHKSESKEKSPTA
jgi:CBS domain containing-hemolysin-like protein